MAKHDDAGSLDPTRSSGSPPLLGGVGATGNFAPFPIPWLDQNLHHNQVPTPNGGPTELSHIYHFKGQVGRALLSGSGQTPDGKTFTFGKGTDFGYMRGEYLTANGDTQFGTFAHI
jgi:hypothetical protein